MVDVLEIDVVEIVQMGRPGTSQFSSRWDWLKVPKSDSIIHDPIERCPLYFIVVTGINGSSYEASLVALIKICTYKRMFNHKTLQLSNKAITINIMC